MAGHAQVNVDKSTQHSQHANSGVQVAGDVTIQVHHQSPPSPVTTSTHVHHHYYGATASNAAPYREPHTATMPPKLAPSLPASSPQARPFTTKEQRYLLDLMDPLDKETRIKVLKFMRDQFHTAMVVELQPHQVYRARKYVEKVLSSRAQQA